MLPCWFLEKKKKHVDSSFLIDEIQQQIPHELLLLFLASPTCSCTEQECNSLLHFLAGLSQDSGLTKSWQNGTDCCTWEGITCSWDKMVTMSSWHLGALRGESHHSSAISVAYWDSTYPTFCHLVFYHWNWRVPSSCFMSASTAILIQPLSGLSRYSTSRATCFHNSFHPPRGMGQRACLC